MEDSAQIKGENSKCNAYTQKVHPLAPSAKAPQLYSEITTQEMIGQ